MPEKLKVKLTGVAPLLMHNGQLADPLNKWTKYLREMTLRKKKTEDDIIEIKRREWFGGLYVDDTGKIPVIPADMAIAVLQAGARKHKNGVEAKSGVFEAKPWFPLEFDGPKGDLDKLYTDGRFVDSRLVTNQRNRIVRTRPIFRDWSVTFEYLVDTEIIDLHKCVQALEQAGERVGLGDYRPRFGRFTVEVVK
jgi:hypothetical protein